MLFPPELVPHVRLALPDHPALWGISDARLGELLTLVFFASLERDEGAHLPIRVVFSGDPDRAPESHRELHRWRHLAFTRPRRCSVLNLRRLSRATLPDWTFIHIGAIEDALVLRGLARQGLGAEDDALLCVISPDPGRLEIWSGGRRKLEYAHGRLVPAPENVILSAGPVQRSLRNAGGSAGVPARAWSAYLDAIAGIVRAMSAHGHGGILIILAAAEEAVHGHGGFRTESTASVLLALERLSELESIVPGSDPAGVVAVQRATLGAEIERAIGEIGGLTALDGATVLSPDLRVRGFGMILPTTDRIRALESSTAEPDSLLPFALEARGARHRAAAAFARDSPGSVVFVSSSDGDLGCMLREAAADHVLVWRFGATLGQREDMRSI